MQAFDKTKPVGRRVPIADGQLIENTDMDHSTQNRQVLGSSPGRPSIKINRLRKKSKNSRPKLTFVDPHLIQAAR